MATVIGVRFKEVGKIYYFDPTDIDFKQNDKVIILWSKHQQAFVLDDIQ